MRKPKNSVVVTPEFRNFLDGLLISDGYYRPLSPLSAMLDFTQLSLHSDWLDLIKKALTENGVTYKEHVRPAHVKVLKNGKTTQAKELLHLVSRSYGEFLLERERWYDGKVKVIPKDLDITSPQMLANWFMGDGNLDFKNNQVNARFFTNSFKEQEVEWLLKEFRNRLDIIGSISHWYKQPFINIKNDDAEKLLDIVRPHVVPSFSYKTQFARVKVIPKCVVCNKDIDRENANGYMKYCTAHWPLHSKYSFKSFQKQKAAKLANTK